MSWFPEEFVHATCKSTVRRNIVSNEEQLSRTWPVGALEGKQFAHPLAETLGRRENSTVWLHQLYRATGKVLKSLICTDSGLNVVHIPALLDEAQCPLCDSPSRSLVWEDNVLPCDADAVEMTCQVMERLLMDVPEVVVAVAILKSFVCQHDTLFQARSARPVFLAACILACKLTTDCDVTTIECYEALADYFTCLVPLLGARIEVQLLVLLDWKLPNDQGVYKSCLEELVPEQCVLPAFAHPHNAPHWFMPPDGSTWMVCEAEKNNTVSTVRQLSVEKVEPFKRERPVK